jgi:hypothetical protein
MAMSHKESKMFVRYDYKCPKCGHVEDRFVHRDERDSQTCSQLGPKRGSFLCARVMVRMPSAPPTTFTHAYKSATKRPSK